MSIDCKSITAPFSFAISLPTRLRSSSVPWSTTRSDWYGCSAEISKNFSPREPIEQKTLVEKTTEKFKRMEKARNYAQNKVESNKTLAHNIELHKKEILYLTRQIEKVTKYQALVLECAVKIQKVARGYLVRKGLEEIMAIRRRSVNTWVKQLKKSDDYYFFKLGSKPLKAALLIQRQVRKFLFRAKMRRILHTYHQIREQRVIEIENFLRTALQIILNKKKISDIKFENYKQDRLVKIRQKLCILLFKTFWRKNKFTFKIVMTRVKKYKRMKRNEQRLRASNADLPQVKPDQAKKNKELLGVAETGYVSSRSSFADDSEFGSEKDENKAKEEVESNSSEIFKKLEAERQQKLTIAKLSYSIPKAKEPLNVLPFLYQKDILEGISPPSHHVTTTRASVFRMNDSNPKRHNPGKSAALDEESNKLLYLKPKTTASSRPKYGNDGNPLYMKPTTAYKMSRWDAEAPGDDVDDHKKNLKPRDDSKVLSPTFTSIQKVSKISKNFVKKEKVPVWRPSTQHYNPYVTNLDNFNVLPADKKNKTRPVTMSSSPRNMKKEEIFENNEKTDKNEFEARVEVNSLTFNAALPNMAVILASYKGFVNTVRPGTEKIRRLSSLK